MITLKILGTPQSKQSARFRIAKKKGSDKNFVMSYQKKSVKDTEKSIAYSVKSQLPKGFVPFDEPISVEVLFVFPPLKSWSKKQLKELEDGAIIYKETKPDLPDNLMKGLFDAMNKIVYTDDAKVCVVKETKKIFGFVPRTEITFNTLK